MKFILPLVLAALSLSSCAYMQTNKNIKEQGRSFKGHKLDRPQQLYKAGGQWYLAASPAEYRLSHDIVHDNIFRKTNEPEMRLLEAENATAYHPISATTAAVLLRPDGYADTSTLAQEIREGQGAWCDSLPHATAQAVRAEFTGPESVALTATPTPEIPSFGWRALSWLDFVIVDIPGTVAYNVAVPVIAPFVFFNEFLSNDNQ